MRFRIYFLLGFVLALNPKYAQGQAENANRVQILLLGSPHWNNYQKEGLDVVQTQEIDILSDRYQAELEQITERISAFKPDKIFIEDTPAQQIIVDSLYQAYLNGAYGNGVRNESVQLGFRVAKKMGHDKLYCIDYRDVSFDFDSVVIAAQNAKQQELLTAIMEEVNRLQTSYNKLIQKEPSIEEVLLFLNSKESREQNLGFYLNKINGVGDLKDFAGAYLVSEWYRRNLYIYSRIQKELNSGNQNIMVLMGAGHTAILRDFIAYYPDWEIVEVADILQPGNH